MRKIRLGVVLIAIATVFGTALTVYAVVTVSALWFVIATVFAESFFWTGAALIGFETYRAVKRTGWRQAPRQLWQLFRYGPESARENLEGPEQGPPKPAE